MKNYFKCIERVDTYTKTSIVTQSSSLKKKIISPLFRTHAFLSNENGEGVHEVISDIANSTDRKPVHVGLAILQHSKLLLLRFIDFLREFLEEGSYSLVYGGKLKILNLLRHLFFFLYYFKIPTASQSRQQERQK